MSVVETYFMWRVCTLLRFHEQIPWCQPQAQATFVLCTQRSGSNDKHCKKQGRWDDGGRMKVGREGIARKSTHPKRRMSKETRALPGTSLHSAMCLCIWDTERNNGGSIEVTYRPRFHWSQHISFSNTDVTGWLKSIFGTCCKHLNWQCGLSLSWKGMSSSNIDIIKTNLPKFDTNC